MVEGTLLVKVFIGVATSVQALEVVAVASLIVGIAVVEAFLGFRNKSDNSVSDLKTGIVENSSLFHSIGTVCFRNEFLLLQDEISRFNISSFN